MRLKENEKRHASEIKIQCGQFGPYRWQKEKENLVSEGLLRSGPTSSLRRIVGRVFCSHHRRSSGLLPDRLISPILFILLRVLLLIPSISGLIAILVLLGGLRHSLSPSVLLKLIVFRRFTQVSAAPPLSRASSGSGFPYKEWTERVVSACTMGVGMPWEIVDVLKLRLTRIDSQHAKP